MSHGEQCCRFHQALPAVCSFSLLPSHQELKQGTDSKGKVLYCALGRRGAPGGRNGLSLDTSALFLGWWTLAAMPGCLQKASIVSSALGLSPAWALQGLQGTCASSWLLLMHSPRLSQHRASAEQPQSDLAKAVWFSTWIHLAVANSCPFFSRSISPSLPSSLFS